MANVEFGLTVGFYFYPCGLIATLFLSQLARYRYKYAGSGPQVDEKHVEKIQRFYAKCVWLAQLALTPLLLASIILASYNAVASRDHQTNFPYSAYLASHIAVLLYFSAGLLPDPDGPWTPSVPHCFAWGVGLLVEAVIAAVFLSEHRAIDAPLGLLDSLFSLAMTRIVLFLIMIFLVVRREFELKKAEPGSVAERRPLLENGDGHANGYGGTASVPAKPDAKKSRDPSKSNWFDYFAGTRVLFPYLWPSNSPLHQATVLLCVILLIAQRVVNILVPLQLGVLVDSLGYGKIPYKEVILYVVYRGLQGQQGVLGSARSVLWIPVSQSLFRRLSCAAFEHVLGLSMDFHLSKRIGEVTSALSRGSAINTFLENFLFQVFPMLFDIFVAAVVFFFKYDAFYTLIVLVIMWSYIFMTIYMAKYRGKQRRDMATKARDMEATKTDAIMAYETVQHNCAVPAETEKYRGHVVTYQKAERLVLLSLNFLNLTQSSVFTVGVAMIVAVSTYKIAHGQQSVSDFVSLITYFAQLQAPLNFFGTFYTMLQNNLIEAERMLELFGETSGVVEKPNAKDLPSPKGEIKFNDVTFAYQDKESVLHGISFTVAPGTKTALVGESGSGKSTCLRLLFRFYDVGNGSITVDGNDVRDLKIDGLRKHIGVVPQDTVLFNATIMYNLLYADPKATEADVYEACKAANIHERIMAFPDQYNTKVGERGLKLSGGERQRIAIARAILKNARILLLDEATASLDSHTERQIQEALERVTAGRTTVTIAHRLSTIVDSDQIIVLHKGKVVERGTHHELLELKGSYHAMWEKQTATDKKKSDKDEAKTEE
ncbi:putative ATP-binding subfamily B [Rosellinia necatrix]|uniref:Putative ATP-binding subfamily B n=1 Tax=Rosellinia necatrix TaxID=77044 RepID=A0A1W2TBG9_ROSNE|nr:putative ATP-binding subfamily B [Rosellinia necatrix]